MTNICEFNQVDHILHPLWDYGWFDVRILDYSMPSSCAFSLSSLLRSLIASRQYHALYALPLDIDDHSPDVHGSFKIGMITPNDFAPASFQDVLGLIEDDFTAPYFSSEPDADQTHLVRSFLNSISTSDLSCFTFQKGLDDKDAVVDWRIHTYWSEYLIVDQEACKVYIVVIGYD